MIKSGLRLSGALLVAIVLLEQSAQAATYYWDTDGQGTAGPGAPPSGIWTVGGNWNTDSTGGAGGTVGTTPTSTDDIVFDATSTVATGAYTVSLGNASVSVNKMTVSTYTATTGGAATIGSSIGDGTITIGIGGLVSSGAFSTTINSNINIAGNQTWGVSNSANPTAITINGAIGGTGNLTIGHSTARAALYSGAINHTGTLTFGGGNGAGTTTVSGSIGSNVTNLTVSSPGPVVFSGNNSFTGTTTITGGNSGTATLKLGSNTVLPTGTVVTLNSSAARSTAKLDLGSGTTSYNTTVAGLLAAPASGGPGARQGGSIVTNSDTTTGGAHTGTLTVTPSGSNDFNGLIQDGATSKVALAMAGAGTLTLSGVNSYTGGTTVSNGTLVGKADAGTVTNVTVTTAVSSGTATQFATVTSSAGLMVGQQVSASNLAAGTYIIGISGTTLSLSANALSTGTASGTFSGYQTIGNGALTASGTGIVDLSGSTSTSVTAVTVSGGTIQNGTLTGTSYATSGGTVSASLAGTGALTQSSGTTTLSGANTYSGGTSVGGGTLLIASSNALQGATGTVSVSAGTLGTSVSTATLGGALTLSGGTLSANSTSVGSLTLASGNFTMSAGTLSLTLASAGSFDQILGGGSFTLTGGLLDLTNSVTDYAATYQILSGFGSGSVSGISISNYDTANYTANLSNAGVLSFAPVPEPSTYALLGMGLGSLYFLRRRNKKI